MYPSGPLQKDVFINTFDFPFFQFESNGAHAVQFQTPSVALRVPASSLMRRPIQCHHNGEFALSTYSCFDGNFRLVIRKSWH
jgi:hypothetical protein